MDSIKGMVIDILSEDTILIEVAYVGNFNSFELDDLVKVRFSAISPPYAKGMQGEELIQELNNSILGAYVSANIGSQDTEGIYKGKISREEPSFRGKRKSI